MAAVYIYIKTMVGDIDKALLSIKKKTKKFRYNLGTGGFYYANQQKRTHKRID